MNTIDNELTVVLNRRASTVVVEDGLDSILDDTALVRATGRHRPDHRSASSPSQQRHCSPSAQAV